MDESPKPKADAFERRPPRAPSGVGLRIGVVSDLHLGWAGEGRETGFHREFLNDLASIPNLDLLVLNGGVSGRGEETFPLVRKELLEKLTVPSYYLAGAAEARTPESLQGYFAISGRPLDGVLFLRGIRMVFLGVPVFGREIPIEAARVGRLARALDEEKATTIIFHPLPLADTVCHSGDYLGRLPGEQPFNTRVPDSEPIKEMLAGHPEVKLWVSGHTRAKHTSVDRFGRGTLRPEGECLHVSVCNLGHRNASAEGRFIFVEGDRLLVRTRNFLRREWVEELTVELPGQTTLEINP